MIYLYASDRYFTSWGLYESIADVDGLTLSSFLWSLRSGSVVPSRGYSITRFDCAAGPFGRSVLMRTCLDCLPSLASITATLVEDLLREFPVVLMRDLVYQLRRVVENAVRSMRDRENDHLDYAYHLTTAINRIGACVRALGCIAGAVKMWLDADNDSCEYRLLVEETEWTKQFAVEAMGPRAVEESEELAS